MLTYSFNTMHFCVILAGALHCWASVDVICEFLRAATAMPAARNFDLSPASDVTECDLLPVSASLWHIADPVIAQTPSSAECSATAAAFNISQYERYAKSVGFHFDVGKCHPCSEITNYCKPASLCNGESALPVRLSNAALDLTASGISCSINTSARPGESFMSSGECVNHVNGVSPYVPESQTALKAQMGSNQPQDLSGRGCDINLHFYS
jgi:hypothetical protein